MAIKRTVETDVYCDICGEWITGWKFNDTGVSKIWAAAFVREKGCTVGKKVICHKVCNFNKIYCPFFRFNINKDNVHKSIIS